MKQLTEPSNALVVDDVAEQKRLLERDRLKAERQKLTRQRRDDKIRHRLSGILLDATKKVDLRRHAFKSDEELTAAGLTEAEKRLVRGWEEAKRNAPYALESSSRQIESHLRGQQEKQSVKLNIGNVEKVVLRLPEKEDEKIEPVVITVEPEK